jgi:phosphoribosylanthranilate isomerase
MTGCGVPRVKICGITNIEDARHASDCGADALGFVFYPDSPRCVDPDRVRQIVTDLPPFVTTVGLFVNESPARIREVVEFCGLDTVQLHGDEKPEQCFYPPRRVIKALRLKDGMDESLFSTYHVSSLLLDAYVPNTFGGTGQHCDWDLAAKVAADHRVILAGGLTAENVTAAVRQVNPYGVDASSGVETKPGEKDPEKVAMFIRMAKESFK